MMQRRQTFQTLLIADDTRQLTTAHIRRLARHFALPADYFLEV